jgi:BASS family bile acid:Na+ symporter
MIDYNLADILVNVVLAIIMLGVGLSLTLNDFKQILLFPKSIITGLSIQIFLIPVIAFVIAYFSNMSAEQKVGIVLVSTCASGASSNLITHLVRGNVALAISMTSLNSIITIVTLPVIVSIALYFFLEIDTKIILPIGETIIQIFLVTILPAIIGITIRRLHTRIAIILEKPLKVILPLILFLVFAIKIFAGKNQGGSGITFSESINILPYVFLLNVLAMTVGYYIAKLVKLEYRNQYTIAIEVGLHNTALALLVAGTILKSPEMEMPALVYSMFTFFTAILFVYVVKGKQIFK